MEVTPQMETEGGYGQNSLRNKWKKLVECEERVRFWKKMLDWKLGVRELESISESIRQKFRSEMREGESNREVIRLVTEMKYRDEKLHQRNLKKEKDIERGKLMEDVNNERKFTRIMSKICNEMRKVRMVERKKYEAKAQHLKNIREREEIEKLEICPTEIEEFREIIALSKKKTEEIEKDTPEVNTIGKVELDSDEMAVLRLPPKFAIRRRLDSLTMQTEIEMGMAKTRYQVAKEESIKQLGIEDEIEDKTRKKQRVNLTEEEMEELEENEILEAEGRRIYDPINKLFNHTKKRATDLAENNKVTLPKPCNNFIESGIEMIRSRVLETFIKYRKRECNDRGEQPTNLSNQERRGLRKLKKRIDNHEIIVLKTDKSGKLTVINRNEYEKLGKEMNKEDRKLERDEIRRIERRINEHSKWWCKMLNSGASHNHQERIIASKQSKSENTAPKYYMFKDHKFGGAIVQWLGGVVVTP